MSHGAIPKVKTPQQEVYEDSQSPKNNEFDSEGSKVHSSNKHFKENQLSRYSKELGTYNDRPPVERERPNNENANRDNQEHSKSTHSEPKPYRVPHDEVIVQRISVDRDTKMATKKGRLHAERKQKGDKPEEASSPPNDTAGEKAQQKAKPSVRKQHHGDKRDDNIGDTTSPEDRPQSDTPKTNHSNDSKEKTKNKQSSNQAEKYEGLPLAPNGNEKSNAGGYKSHKSTSNKGREKHKQVCSGNTSWGHCIESGKDTNSRNLSLTFPGEGGNKSVMRIVVRSFASATKSQNCVDVKIEGEKFNVANMKNPDIERLIRELTKYVIQIQKKLEKEDDESDKSHSDKSKRDQHKNIEVVELFRRGDKSSGKPGKEANVPLTKSRLDVNMSLKCLPSTSGKESKLERSKLPSKENDKKREHGKAQSPSENSCNNKCHTQTSNANGEVEKTLKRRKDGGDKPERKKSKKGMAQKSGAVVEDVCNEKDDAVKRGKGKHHGKKEGENICQGDGEGNLEGCQPEGAEVGTHKKKSKRKGLNPEGADATSGEVHDNTEKHKTTCSTEGIDRSTKKRDQSKKTRSCKEGRPVLGDGQDSKKSTDKKISLASVKRSLSKMLVKMTASKTVVAQGPTAAIRQKHKEAEEAEKCKVKCKKSRSHVGERVSSTKAFQIPVLFEENEPALQSKSSVKIQLDHSTKEGNLCLNLVGILNDDTQDFGGHLKFSQAYDNPKKKCEDVETMKELLTNCVKKVENVLNNLEKNDMKNSIVIQHSGKIRDPESKQDDEESPPSSIHRRISFKEDDGLITDILPFSGMKEDELSETCSGGPDGECVECHDFDEKDALFPKDKNVNDIVQAKLDAGEFAREAKKSLQQERYFSKAAALKDPDALKKYKKKKSKSSKDNDRDQPSGVLPVQSNDDNNEDLNDEAKNGSKVNLAISVSAEDEKTTSVMGIATWPDDSSRQSSISSENIEDPPNEETLTDDLLGKPEATQIEGNENSGKNKSPDEDGVSENESEASSKSPGKKGKSPKRKRKRTRKKMCKKGCRCVLQ